MKEAMEDALPKYIPPPSFSAPRRQSSIVRTAQHLRTARLAAEIDRRLLQNRHTNHCISITIAIHRRNTSSLPILTRSPLVRSLSSTSDHEEAPIEN